MAFDHAINQDIQMFHFSIQKTNKQMKYDRKGSLDFLPRIHKQIFDLDQDQLFRM
jgi:hypothetical protein